MPDTPSLDPLTAFVTFGDLLKYLRRRARLSQRELSIALGYSESQVSRLESNLRAPDAPTLAALFVPALGVEDEPEILARLMALAAEARGQAAPETAGETVPEPGIAASRSSRSEAGAGRQADLEDHPAPTPPNNLPVQWTSFIGRGHEIAEARRLLRGARLLTLTGPGGTGKTRLSLQVAAELLPDFPQGVWLVELAPIAQPALVPQVVAQALAVSAEPGRTLQQVLADHLRGQTVLMVLDNCEHLVEACAQLAEQLLRAAPGLRILATSREALGIGGEIIYPVPSLSLPNLPVLPPLATLAGSEAVRLFVERATAARPDFALTEAHAAAVAQICRRLDGIPLALELAAVRTQALSVEQIAARLDDRFGLLSGGSRTAPPRQQTLRGAIDWSYDLLAETERSLLRHLSVFAGGWTLEAAEHVAGESTGALDTLVQLVGKSLVQSEQLPGQETRFGMHETIRQYAQEKLVETGEGEAARGRHLAFFLALTEAAEPELKRHDQLAWLNRLERENDNLRAALSWALKTQKAESALRLAGALFDFWDIRGYDAEGRRYLAEALSLPDSLGSLRRSSWRAKALLGAGWLGEDDCTTAGEAWLPESISIYRELGDKAGMAHALMYLGIQRILQNKAAGALLTLEEALELWLAAEDDAGIGQGLWAVGYAFDDNGEHAKALEFYQRSEAILRDAGDRLGRLWPLTHLAWQAWLDGEGARARALFIEILAARDEFENKSGIWWTLRLVFEISLAQGHYDQARQEALALRETTTYPRNPAAAHVRLGQVEYLQGHLPEARAHFEAGLKIFRELNDLNGMGWTPPWLGCVAYRLGELDQARALINEGLAIDDPDGYWPELAFALFSLGDVTRAQGETATAAQLYARSLAMILAHGARPDMAQYLEAFAKLALLAERPERAARLLGAAAALREQFGTPVPPVERADHDQAVAQARAQLGLAAFSVAWDAGLTLGWEQAAQYALA